MEKIYVTLIEGTRTYVPVDAVRLADNTYQIVSNEHEDPTDYSLVWQFFTGDIVRCSEKEEHLYATELVESVLPMRRLRELIFLIVDRMGELSKEERASFAQELEVLCRIGFMQQKYPASKEWLARSCGCEE